MIVMLLASFTVNVNPNFLASRGLSQAFAVSGYHYLPAFNAAGSGTSFFDIPDNPSLRLTRFSAAAWFNTTKDHYTDQIIVNKGGIGLETAGNNMDYGIWMDSSEKIRGGFERSNGTDYIAVSPTTYNNGLWHYAVVTYDGSIVRLYVDGVQVGTKVSTATPDIGGSQPLRIGANSQGSNRYFTGQIDEVRVWNRALTAGEVSDQYNSGVFNAAGLLLHMNGVTSNGYPVANAGPDQTVNEAAQVTLNGAGSTDPDGDPLTYSWNQTIGPTVSLSNSAAAVPTFTAPNVTSTGVTLTFELSIGDGKNGTATDTVNIVVQNINRPPIADAGPNQTVGEGVQTFLNGSNSSDIDGDILSFSWIQINGTVVTLSNVNTATPSFTSPSVGPSGTTLVFKLTVNDGHGGNATDTVDINVQNNISVKAVLSANTTTLNEGKAASLDGSSSTGDVVSYLFVQIAGTAGTIVNGSNPAKATFVAPSSVSADETASIKLTVKDSYKETDSTIMNITVRHVNKQPTANAGPDQTANEGSVVSLNGTGSTDEDHSPQSLRYLWQQIDASGFIVTLSNTTSATPSFSAPQISVNNIVLTFRLTVNDSASSNTDFVNINVTNVAVPGYHYLPAFNAAGSGTSFFDIPDNPSLRLTRFSAAAWFNTTKNYTTEGAIVNKGGIGLETAGNNMDYGIWMDSSEKVRGGFETSIGADHVVTSTNSYSNGLWHYAVVTYDGTIVRLYVDGVQVGTHTTTATPDIGGIQPLRIGANSLANNRYFTGGIDEVRVWNRALTASEVSDQYNSGVFNAAGLLLHMNGVTANRYPVANAGPDQTVNEATQVTLNGGGSTDPDGDPLAYAWTQTIGPAVSIVNATTASPSFTAPDVNSTGATLTFELRVGDGKGGSASDTMNVVVQNANLPPVANAGPDQAVNEGTDPVILNGSASSDPDNDPLTYSWIQTIGPAMSLDDPTVANPTFTAPILASNVTLGFALTVSDGKTNSTDTVSVVIINTVGGYQYSPSFNATGSTRYDIPDHSSLRLQRFSAAAWFSTSKSYTTDALIVNKGGIGLETAGNNMDYGIWMKNDQKVHGGFESSTGADHVAVSPATYNDGRWHYAVVTYDGTIVRLYVDGVQVGTHTTTASPDIGGNQPLRIGANSQGSNRYFTGGIDEVRVWNRALTAGEVSDQYLSGAFFNDGLLVYMNGVSHSSMPVANAGPDQTVNEEVPVTLNGAGSSDPDGTPITYSWNQTAGPIVTLSNATVANPTFNSPNVSTNTLLTFDLTVRSGIDNNTDTVNITVINSRGGYRFSPSRSFDGGSNYLDVPDNSTLRLTTAFTLAAWFKTSTDYASNAMIASKGSLASQTAGQNVNYGIWMDSSEKIRGGFETASGSGKIATSTSAFNDNLWHYAMVTYDHANVKLYIDGSPTGSAVPTNTTPDTGTQPVRIGADSQTSTNYFSGEIDEVRVWNRALTSAEADAQFDLGTYNATGERLHLTMQEIPIAEAGPIQLIMDNATTGYLNASASVDPDSSGPLTYLWSQVSGPVVVLNGLNNVSSSFPVMNVTGEKKLIFQVRVGDGQFFSTDKVSVYIADTGITNKILQTPAFKNDLANEIRNARYFVYIDTYYVETFATNSVINELVNATRRGVDVRLIYDPHTDPLYPSTNETLTSYGIPFKVIPSHAKLAIIDNITAFVGSANLNNNGLNNNWEMTLKTNNPDTISEGYRFLDVMWRTGSKVTDNIDKYYERFVNGNEHYNLLIDAIKNAHSIKVLMFEVTYNSEDPNALDSNLLQEIKNAYTRGAELDLLLDDPRYLEITRGVQFLKQNNVPFKVDDKNTGTLQKVHAKACLIDDKILFIGSPNWSDDSLGLAQETSIITRNPQTISDWLTIFNQKWSLGHYP